MQVFEFSLILQGLDPMDEDIEDRLHEAGCDDAILIVQRGAVILTFAREGQAFSDAMVSACRDAVGAGATVARIEPDHLVNQIEIAARAGLTRAAVSNYVAGSRGDAFPPPCARATTKTPLWDWAEVAAWFCRNGIVGDTAVRRAQIVRRLNIALQSEPLRDPARLAKLVTPGADGAASA